MVRECTYDIIVIEQDKNKINFCTNLYIKYGLCIMSGIHSFLKRINKKMSADIAYII